MGSSAAIHQFPVRPQPVVPAAEPPSRDLTLGAQPAAELDATARRVKERTNALMDYLDWNRPEARQKGVEGIIIELGALMNSERLERSMDAVSRAANERGTATLSPEGLGALQRAERLVSEADMLLSRSGVDPAALKGPDKSPSPVVIMGQNEAPAPAVWPFIAVGVGLGAVAFLWWLFSSSESTPHSGPEPEAEPEPLPEPQRPVQLNLTVGQTEAGVSEVPIRETGKPKITEHLRSEDSVAADFRPGKAVPTEDVYDFQQDVVRRARLRSPRSKVRPIEATNTEHLHLQQRAAAQADVSRPRRSRASVTDHLRFQRQASE